jgi:GT2 family glycosyltransferase
MSATVIIPTTGDRKVVRALRSAESQTYDPDVYVIVDGREYLAPFHDTMAKKNYIFGSKVNICTLPKNVGADGFYGHRIFSAFAHLVNTDYVLFLDQDNSYRYDHVNSLVSMLDADPDLDFVYSLRNIYDAKGEFVCRDDCESLGKWPVWNSVPESPHYHVDTSAYCFRTSWLVRIADAWHGGYAQDRKFYNMVRDQRHECSGKYTLNYYLGSSETSASAEFFTHGNYILGSEYSQRNEEFPWSKE